MLVYFTLKVILYNLLSFFYCLLHYNARYCIIMHYNFQKGSIYNLRRGSAKIEFYQNFDTIKNAYNNGLIVYKLLYEHLQEKINLQMSYRTFYQYAKKEFEPKQAKIDSPTLSKNKGSSTKDIDKSMNEYIKNFEHIVKG